MGLGNAASFQLLQFLYKDLDDQLQQTSRRSTKARAQPPSPEIRATVCKAGGARSDDGPDSPASDRESDEDLEEWDDREFLQFEVRFGQLNAGVNVKSAVTEVETEAKSQLEYFEDRIQSQASPPTPHSDNRFSLDRRGTTDSTGWEDLGNAHEYAERVIQDGGPDDQSRGIFVPSTLQEWRATVNRFTSLNKLIESLHLRENCDTSYASKPAAPDDTQTDEAYEALYNALVDQHAACATRTRQLHGLSSHRHFALLQLSGFHGSTDRVLQLLLSACGGTESKPDQDVWHETTCKFDSHSPTHHHRQLVVTDLCQQIRICKAHQIPLTLSYSHKGLWSSPRPLEQQKLSPQTSDQVSLASLLGGGSLDGDSLDMRLKKSRLALQLAAAVQKLYPGPWLQDNWSPKLIQFVHDQNSDRVDRLDQPYIPCTITGSWKSTNEIFKGFDRPMETCPPFFLSFAQLLVDIAKGETKSQHCKASDPVAWYRSLLEELNSSFHDEIFRWYGKAIQGCLQYSIDFSLESSRIKEPRRRAQTIIRENIVHHLERDLGVWEKKWQEDVTVGMLSLKLTSKDGTGEREQPARRPTRQSTRRLSGRSHRSSFTDLDDRMASRTSEPTRFTLFADGDEIYEKRGDIKPAERNAFMERMETHKLRYIMPLPKHKAGGGANRNIRIAVLDTGLRVDDSDMLLCGGEHRIRQRQNFVDPDDADCTDTHGHGTHVTRLLLRFAPRADIIVAKIAEGRSLQETKLAQLIQALRWAGHNADIINLSFGLGALSINKVGQEIKALVRKGKLIFAAASNSGGNGPRAYPARENGVFCIHATDERGDKARGMNPARLERPWDNFSTLGVRIDSCWDGQDVCISGTSFATPVAAAIAANSLEFIRRKLNQEGDMPEFFSRFAGMRLLFHEMADYIDGYDYVRPWKEGLWDDTNVDDMEAICERLREIYTTKLMSTGGR